MVWDRPSLRQDRSRTKKSGLVLILVLQVWCCVLKHGLVTLVVIMILKDTATFQVLFIISLYSLLGTSLLWRSTVAFTYLHVKAAKCLCLLPVVLVLVLRIRSCLHHWRLATCAVPDIKAYIAQRSLLTEPSRRNSAIGYSHQTVIPQPSHSQALCKPNASK